MQFVNLICLENKWKTYLPLKTNVTIVRTKYEILISRKQCVQQQIKYITESIHSNPKQIFLQANPFGGLFSVAFLLIDSTLSAKV